MAKIGKVLHPLPLQKALPLLLPLLLQKAQLLPKNLVQVKALQKLLKLKLKFQITIIIIHLDIMILIIKVIITMITKDIMASHMSIKLKKK